MFDDRCVFDPKFDETRESIQGDQVILALGQAADLSFLQSTPSIEARNGLITVDEASLETGMTGVYAGGDVTAFRERHIHAVAAGRKAASAMDKAMGGTGDIEEVLFEKELPISTWGAMRDLQAGRGKKSRSSRWRDGMKASGKWLLGSRMSRL